MVLSLNSQRTVWTALASNDAANLLSGDEQAACGKYVRSTDAHDIAATTCSCSEANLALGASSHYGLEHGTVVREPGQAAARHRARLGPPMLLVRKEPGLAHQVSKAAAIANKAAAIAADAALHAG